MKTIEQHPSGGPGYSKSAISSLNSSPHYPAQPYSDDEAACSDDTQEPSLTNSSFSVNSSSSTSDNHHHYQQQHPLATPAPLHRLPLVSTHSSLLDVEREDTDESITEDDFSADHGLSFHSPSTSMLQQSQHAYPDDSNIVSESASFMEQTENNLANISESLSGSFCIPNDVNACSLLSDCTTTKNTSTSSVQYSDQIVNFRLMQDFNYLLGSSIMPCCEEKSIFNTCFGKTPVAEDGNGKGKIRNRAGESLRARAYRVKRLRKSRMVQDPTNTTGVWNGSMGPPGIGLAHSMDGDIHQSKSFQRAGSVGQNATFKREPVVRKPNHEVNADPLGCIIGDCIEPISPIEGEDNELEVVWKNNQDLLDEHDLCYDSDPGESSYRDLNEFTSPPRNGLRAQSEGCIDNNNHKNNNYNTATTPIKPKKAKAKRRMYFNSVLEENQVSLADDSMSVDNIDVEGEGETYSSNKENNDRSTEEKYWDANSHISTRQINTSDWEDDIMKKVQDALNRTWTLTWHPTSANFKKDMSTVDTSRTDTIKSSPLRGLALKQKPIASNITAKPPRTVHLWFERGNRIRRNDIVEPKLMWREAYHPDLASQRKLNLSSTIRPHQTCLLSICRILPLNQNLDRKKYSFAKKSFALLIRTCDDHEFVFEANSQEERDELLYVWKLVVARLASQAVVGDGESMVGEFFVPTSFGVP